MVNSISLLETGRTPLFQPTVDHMTSRVLGWGREGEGRGGRKQKALLGYVSAITAIIGVCWRVRYGSVDSAPSRNLFAQFGLQCKFLPDLQKARARAP